MLGQVLIREAVLRSGDTRVGLPPDERTRNRLAATMRGIRITEFANSVILIPKCVVGS